MHSYLRAIGFSEIKDRKELEKILSMIMDEPTDKKTYKINDHKTVTEISKDFSKHIGITIRGEYDDNGTFHLGHYFPYVKSQYLSTNEEISVIKRVDTDAYTVMCDDVRFGVSLMFYLQNVIDFLSGEKTLKFDKKFPIYLSALSTRGKILLPIYHDEKLRKSNNAEIQYRRNLIAEAKKGNQEAIDSLTIDDIDIYAMISRRAKHEDIYSIVETSFTPYGSESDNYSILGTIVEVEKEVNDYTKEEVYMIVVNCNDVIMPIVLNKKDLYGEPAVGRRFKGTIWTQGFVEFSSENI
ncbi:MAG: DUF3881 family protein [Clostridiales bacterium]|mgnify:CR=1 FL=1|nr:DUF3881 family protein [Clostridiales bacterium]